MDQFECSIDDVLDTVRHAKESNRKCCLLIGAGCSVSGGVPLASTFLKRIKREFPSVYERAADPKGYPQCMALLGVGERRDLLGQVVDRAKVNWAHLAIAQLMKEGYVDRVLTTNFDPLVIRACAMVDRFPAVYDFAASQTLNPAAITGEAVFYLHGQRNGFVLMNTEEECVKHSRKLKKLFENAGQGRVWIVVGYSGQNDPVFQHLAKVPSFDHKLFWVGYKDNPLADHIRDGLMQKGKYAYHLPGYDADEFFVTLSQRLDCFPPRLISEPFTNLKNLLDGLTEYKIPQQDSAPDITKVARQMIRRAIDTLEFTSGIPFEAECQFDSLSVQVARAYMAGNYEQVINLVPPGHTPSENIVDELVWAYIFLGNEYRDQAKKKTGDEASRLFLQAGEKYSHALQFKPNHAQALYNWGQSLRYQSSQSESHERAHLLTESASKFQSAEELTPGVGAYDLARINAIIGEELECRKWLERARAVSKLPTRKHLLNDNDLNPVQGTEWFKQLIAELPE